MVATYALPVRENSLLSREWTSPVAEYAPDLGARVTERRERILVERPTPQRAGSIERIA
jgi:hypothetical protein